MADVISASFDRPVTDRDLNAAPARSGLRYDLIELLFFAYRDFVGEADSVLAEYGFWRAHHRVLHFVDRNPGIRVAELLAILQITKQSLGRVLKELVDKGFIEQRPGATDRRQRLLHTTDEGHQLARRLAEIQDARIGAALAKLGPGAADIARDFLIELVDQDERQDVARLTRTGGQRS